MDARPRQLRATPVAYPVGRGSLGRDVALGTHARACSHIRNGSKADGPLRVESGRRDYRRGERRYWVGRHGPLTFPSSLLNSLILNDLGTILKA